MTIDKKSFEKLKGYKVGSIKVDNNDGFKIMWKRIFKLEEKWSKFEDVLLVVGLKHNLLSII